MGGGGGEGGGEFINQESTLEVQKEFWQRSRVRLGNHPASHSHIPVSLYGDEVVVNRQGDSIAAIYPSLTLWKPERVRCAQYQVFAMRSHRIAGCHTCGQSWGSLRNH